ncbi:MAG: lysophospholipid acyltransferase family protein [Daejeonella sp.]|uniref:lysophospholipid acyltransferase family protein n=1 Tax=Daejeonella sp. TaxID=2805397 RepID=UPI0027344820|nr:lysophospholipid acyltransferase family protein [Daejeonella sp.]MDP3468214.1 lysophospholipid acyltransferase family protein [Daejeonella sp.]
MNKVTFRVISCLLYLISLLPFPVLYFLSDTLYIILYYIIKYRRKVVADNLSNSFPEKSKSELEQIEKRFYRYLADLILESVKTISISAKEIKKRFVFKNLEIMKTYIRNGKSLIAVSGHYGNWEWGTVAIGLQLKDKALIVYKPLSDKRFEVLITSMRSRFGSMMVPMKQTLRKVNEHKNDPNVLVLVGDQTPTREESRYFTSFLNQQTAVFLGVEKIALKLKTPIVYFSINRIKRGYYECVIKPLIENPELTKEYEITEAHTKELENNICFQPEYWLWSHKRWKFSPENLNND